MKFCICQSNVRRTRIIHRIQSKTNRTIAFAMPSSSTSFSSSPIVTLNAISNAFAMKIPVHATYHFQRWWRIKQHHRNLPYQFIYCSFPYNLCIIVFRQKIPCQFRQVEITVRACAFCVQFFCIRIKHPYFAVFQ